MIHFATAPFCIISSSGGKNNPGVKKMESNMLPLGLGMALAQNEAAMQRFTSMTEAEKKALIEQCHQVKSKREMQQLVNQLTN